MTKDKLVYGLLGFVLGCVLSIAVTGVISLIDQVHLQRAHIEHIEEFLSSVSR